MMSQIELCGNKLRDGTSSEETIVCCAKTTVRMRLEHFIWTALRSSADVLNRVIPGFRLNSYSVPEGAEERVRKKKE